MFKRIFSVFLCFILLFVSVLRPLTVSATSIDDSVLDDVEGIEIIWETDEAGYIVYDGSLFPFTYSAAAGLLISGAGSSSFLGGSAALAGPGALVILAIIIAAGIIIPSIPALADTVNRIYVELSEDVRIMFDDLVESGQKFVSVTEDVRTAVLSAMFAAGIVTADGKLNISKSFSNFDVNGFLNYNSYYRQTSTFNDWSECTYPLIYNTDLGLSPAHIEGTNLTIQQIFGLSSTYNMPSGINAEFGLKIVNEVLGTSLIMAYPIKYYSCSTYRVANPLVSSSTWGEKVYGSKNPIVSHNLTFNILRTCQTRVAGESCSICSSTYSAHLYGTGSSFKGSNVYYLLDGVSIPVDIRNHWVKNLAISYPTVDNISTYADGFIWTFADAIDDADTKTKVLTNLPTATLVGVIDVPITDTDEDDQAIPIVGTDVFFPPTLDDLDKYTQTDALNPGITVPDVDANTTFWEKLLAWLETILGTLTGILDNIIAFPKTIADAFTAFWEKLWEWLQSILDALTGILEFILSIPQTIIDGIISGITDVLEYLFVPDLTAVQEFVDTYNSKFDWVADLFNFGADILDSLNPTEPPKIPIKLSAADGKYNYGSDGYILDMNWYSKYKSSVDNLLSGILWFFFIWAMFRRIPDILSGVGMIEESERKGKKP